jgi:hypothetical protein
MLQTGLIALLWFDNFTHVPNLCPTAPAAALAPNTIREHFKWDQQLQPGVSRAFQSKEALWKMLSLGSTNMEIDVTGRRRFRKTSA